tara:strand:+ start:191 stop:1339 length:1149 start_codon:yes stop_codon:yes gene_type:complete
MGKHSVGYLKGSNRNFDNILDSYLNLKDTSQDVEGAVNHGIKSRDRYYLEEYFEKLPKLNAFLEGSETKDFGSLAAAAEVTEDVTVTGAALGDFAMASLGVDTQATVGLIITAEVTAANTVSVTLSNQHASSAIDLASTTLTAKVVKAGANVANPNFEVLGTGMTDALATRSATRAAMTLTTAGSDADQAILAPHLDAGATAWTGVKWGTENYTEYEALITTSAAIDNQKIWAGLKLTHDQLPQTDANQAYFYFSTDLTNGQNFADFTKLYFINSVGGVDYLTDTGITVTASTDYHLKIKIDGDRKVSIFVNGAQYGVSNTAITAFDGSTSVTGTVVSDAGQKSLAMTDDIDLIPYVGIEAGDGAAAALDVSYCAINRILFE